MRSPIAFAALRLTIGTYSSCLQPIADQAARHGLELRQYIDIVHKQHVYVSLAEGDDCVGRRANNWLVVIEGCIDDKGHLGTRKKTRYQLVKAPI
jgi:hypothetical protein